MSTLRIGDWLETLRGVKIHIPSARDVEQEIRKKYGEIIFTGQIKSAIVSSPFGVYFPLPASRKEEGELIAKEVKGFVKPDDLDGIDEELFTENLTQRFQRKYSDCFVINPSLNKEGLIENSLVNAEKYWCDVEYTSLGKTVRLKTSGGGMIQITSDNF